MRLFLEGHEPMEIARRLYHALSSIETYLTTFGRVAQQKTTSQVAVATHHHPEDVEYYVQCLRRIELRSEAGTSVEEISQATGHSPSLVREYLDLIQQFHLPPYSEKERAPREAPRPSRPRAKRH